MGRTLDQSIKEYTEYIDMHIANVKKAYNFYGKKLCDFLQVDYDRLGDMIKDHDKSKYSKEEFEGYRCHWYPTEEEELDRDGAGYRQKKYDAAWLHHLRNNSHHPEFWIRNNDGNPVCETMGKIHIAEMLLDWAGVGIYKDDTAFEYWIDNAYDKPMNMETMNIVDSCIHIFKEKYKE